MVGCLDNLGLFVACCPQSGNIDRFASALVFSGVAGCARAIKTCLAVCWKQKRIIYADMPKALRTESVVVVHVMYESTGFIRLHGILSEKDILDRTSFSNNYHAVFDRAEYIVFMR